MSRTPVAVLVLAFSILGSAGCGPRTQYHLQPELEAGQPFDHTLVPYLIEGATTQGEVMAWLGEPFHIEKRGELEVWYYYYRRSRDRLGEDWTGKIVDESHSTIEEHAATLTFMGEVLRRIEDRPDPFFMDDPWIRATHPEPVAEGTEFGPESRPLR